MDNSRFTISKEELEKQKEYTALAKALIEARFEGKAPKAFVHTYGCQGNVSDGERLQGMLQQIGYTFTDDVKKADLVLYNTCAIREHAEDRIYGNVGALKQYKKSNPNLIIALCGCMMQQERVAEKIKNAFRNKFIKDGIVQSGGQTAMAYAIAMELYNENEMPAAASYLNQLVIDNGYHFDCGMNGTKYVVTALGEHGYCDTVYKAMINPDCPSPANWILSGLTTCSEYWEMKNSYNHPARASLDTWFYKYLAGIHIYGEYIVVEPQFVEGIDWVKASYGGVSVEWNDKEIRIVLSKPADIVISGQKVRKTNGEWIFKRENKPLLN